MDQRDAAYGGEGGHPSAGAENGGASQEWAAAPGEPHPELRKDDSARVLTGVCAGLGNYTRTDPVVWRTAFVLTALAGGTGLWLYLCAWGLMRDGRGGPGLIEQLLNRRLAPQAVLALLGAGLTAAIFLSLFGGISWGTLILSVPLVLGLLAARNRGVDLQRTARDLPGWLQSSEPPPPAPEPEPEPSYYNPSDPWSAAPEGPVDLTLVAEQADAGTGQPADNSAGGHSRGREARGRAKKERRKRGIALAPFVLWAIVIAAGVAFAAAGGPSASALVGAGSGTVYLGSVVVIVGAALIMSTWIGDGRGLIAVGTLAAVLAVTSMVVDMTNVRVASVTWRPEAVEQIERPYELTAGRAVLDLSGLPLEAGETVDVVAQVGFGELQVQLPGEALVELRGQMGFGEFKVEESAPRSGFRFDVRETLEPTDSVGPAAEGDGDEDTGASGEAGGDPPVLVVNLRSHGGDVTVHRVS